MVEIKRFSGEGLDETIEEGVESKLKIDFDELLEIRKKLKNTNLIDDAGIDELLPEDNDEAVKEGWSMVVERISRETKAFDKLEEMGIVYNLIQGLESGKYQAQVKFDQQIEDGAEGEFDLWSSKIRFQGQPPSRQEMWLSLATSGTSHRIVETLEHELIHSFQWTKLRKGKALFKILATFLLSLIGLIPGWLYLKKLVKDEERSGALREIQAFKSGELSGLDINSAIKLITFLKRRYGCQEVDVLIAAVVEVERLKALGLTEKGIASLVSRAKWDKKTSSFPLLEKEMNKSTNEKGLDIEDVDNLVLAKRIEREIEFQKARIIAQEELIKLRDKKSPHQNPARKQVSYGAGKFGAGQAKTQRQFKNF